MDGGMDEEGVLVGMSGMDWVSKYKWGREVERGWIQIVLGYWRRNEYDV